MISHLHAIAIQYSKEFKVISISIDNMSLQNFSIDYNKKIRNQIDSKSFGVYIITNPKSNAVFYVGMAGKFKQNGEMTNHTLAKRLTAPRYKDNESGKYVQTNKYIYDFLKAKNINSISIHVYYIKNKIPPTYLESLILFEFFKISNNKLPELNKFF